jgi:hypothetical protein
MRFKEKTMITFETSVAISLDLKAVGIDKDIGIYENFTELSKGFYKEACERFRSKLKRYELTLEAHRVLWSHGQDVNAGLLEAAKAIADYEASLDKHITNIDLNRALDFIKEQDEKSVTVTDNVLCIKAANGLMLASISMTFKNSQLAEQNARLVERFFETEGYIVVPQGMRSLDGFYRNQWKDGMDYLADVAQMSQ